MNLYGVFFTTNPFAEDHKGYTTYVLAEDMGIALVKFAENISGMKEDAMYEIRISLQAGEKDPNHPLIT